MKTSDPPGLAGSEPDQTAGAPLPARSTIPVLPYPSWLAASPSMPAARTQDSRPTGQDMGRRCGPHEAERCTPRSSAQSVPCGLDATPPSSTAPTGRATTDPVLALPGRQRPCRSALHRLTGLVALL